MAHSDSELSEAKSRFGDRFGYVRWLKHLERGEALDHADIGRAIGRTGPAVSAWQGMREPPAAKPDFYTQVADYFGVSREWLFEDKDGPPHPDLWKAWIAARERHRPVRAAELSPAQIALAPRPGAKAKRRKRGNDR